MFEMWLFAFLIFIMVLIALFLASRWFANARRTHELLDEKEARLLKLYQTIEETMDEYNDAMEQSRSEILQLKSRLDGTVKNAVAAVSAAAEEYKDQPPRQETFRPLAEEDPPAPEPEPPAPPRRGRPPSAKTLAARAAAQEEAYAAPVTTAPPAYAPPPAPPPAYAPPAPPPAPAPPAQAARPPAPPAYGDRPHGFDDGMSYAQDRAAVMETARPARNSSPAAAALAAAGMGKNGVPEAPPAGPRPPDATSKNTDILNLAKQGQTRAQIARRLNITQSEVDLVIGLFRN